MRDIRESVGPELDRADMQYQQYQSSLIGSALNALVRQRVIDAAAARLGKSKDELIAAAAGPGGLNPSDAEIVSWYQQNTSRIGSRQLVEVQSQIAELLRNQKRLDAEARLEAKLNADAGVVITYQPYRLKFDNGDSPAAGATSAPVTLIEFSDFQCPFCRQFTATLKAVEEKYGDNVRIVYRQFPIASIHPFAVKAAEASLCAHDQGKFWQLHDAMFRDQNKLSIPDLKQVATSLGLDRVRFDQCLESGTHAAQVARDIREGERVGVSGTPAFFVNGIELRGGAVPFETITEAINQELLRARPRNP
jgi:protein-disulfide isomerase